MAPAREGNAVKIRYIGRLDDGTVIESSLEDFTEDDYGSSDPLEITLGEGNHLEGLENAIIGMEPEQEKLIRLEADNAYGTYNPELVIPAKASQIPPEILPEVGDSVEHVIQGEEDLAIKISRLTEENVIIDANHPLIEKAINFEIMLLEVSEREDDPEL